MYPLSSFLNTPFLFNVLPLFLLFFFPFTFLQTLLSLSCPFFFSSYPYFSPFFLPFLFFIAFFLQILTFFSLINLLLASSFSLFSFSVAYLLYPSLCHTSTYCGISLPSTLLSSIIPHPIPSPLPSFSLPSPFTPSLLHGLSSDIILCFTFRLSSFPFLPFSISPPLLP